MAIISIFARIVHTFSDFLNILFCMMLFVKIYSRGYCIWCHVHFVGNVLIPPAGFFQRHDLPGVNSLLRFTFFLVLYGFRLFYTAFSRFATLFLVLITLFLVLITLFLILITFFFVLRRFLVAVCAHTSGYHTCSSCRNATFQTHYPPEVLSLPYPSYSERYIQALSPCSYQLRICHNNT